MPIYQYGQTPSVTPGVKVQIVPPQTTYLTPAQTDILGIVGTANWGPVNQQTPVSGYPNFVAQFGPQLNRARDLGTAVNIAQQQGSQAQICVRVTDGTDVAATAILGLMTNTSAVVSGGASYTTSSVVTLSNGAVINVTGVSGGAITAYTVATQPTSVVTGAGAVTAVSAVGGGTGATFTWTYKQGLSLASKYTGSGANADTAQLMAGNQVGTWAVVISHPGRSSETFQNIGLGLTGLNLWTAIAAAINNGIGGQGPSQIMPATVGTSTAAPTAQTVTLSGGTDGWSGVTDTMLIGSDSAPRTGMYALRKSGAALGMLADCTTESTFPTQIVYGLSEGTYMVGVTPAGDTISNAATTKASTGIDSYAFKLMFGDWCYWLDSVNNILQRLVSPQAFVAGWLAANGPQNSSLNKQLQGIIATQKSTTLVPYQDDELAQLYTAGIDVIATPCPGGPYFGAQNGHNTSSNNAIWGDNYSRMTNFLAATINTGVGPFIGQIQYAKQQRQAKATLTAFLSDLQNANPPVIGNSSGTTPFSVTIGNNAAQVAAGKEIATVQVQYGAIIEQFIVNIEGGQSVVITSTVTTSAP